MWNKPPPPRLSVGKRWLMFLAVHWAGVVVFLVPCFWAIVLLMEPNMKQHYCAYTLLVMACYWVSECIPLPITSFLPVLIFPLSSIMPTHEVAMCYFNDTVLMFIGSLLLAASVEQSGLHLRIALGAVRAIGYSHFKLVGAISFTTMFISMWIANTAATTMMVPIVFALLHVFEDNKLLKIYGTDVEGEKFANDKTVLYFCATTYAATIGGIGTLVGTGTNLVFRGLYQDVYPDDPEYLSFPKFSAFAVPYMLVMQLFTCLSLSFVYLGFLRPGSAAAKQAGVSDKGVKAAQKEVDSQWKKLGKPTMWEIMVLILFSASMIGFFSRAPQIFRGWGDAMEDSQGRPRKYIKDSVCAFIATLAMCLLPNCPKFFDNCNKKNVEDLPKGPVPSVLLWTKNNIVMPWSFCFLLGGGFALSTGSNKDHSDLNGSIGTFLSRLKEYPEPVALFIIIVVTIFITNFASNVACCNVITPIAMAMASQISQSPLKYCITSGYCCSYCFMLPVGTPGNLIVQCAAKIRTKDMIKAGALPTLFVVLISFVAFQYWAPIVWPVLKQAGEPPTTTTAEPGP